MERNYELHYEILSAMLKDEMLQHESLEKFTRYDETLGVSKLYKIIDTTTNSFFRENSPFIKELNGIFKTFTKGMCLWDEDKVFGNLVGILVQQFIETMRQALPPVSMNHLDEISYNKFMLDTKFNVIFFQQCGIFFNDKVRNIAKLHMDGILTKMEELL
jgi:hypothetical protein